MRALRNAHILAIAAWSVFLSEFVLAFLLLAMTLWLACMPYSSHGSLRWLAALVSIAGLSLAVAVGRRKAPMLQEIAFRAETSNKAFGGSLITMAEEMTSCGAVHEDVLGASEMIASQAIAKGGIPVPDPPWRAGHASVMCAMAMALAMSLLHDGFIPSVVEFLWPSTATIKATPYTPSPAIAMKRYSVTVSHPKLPDRTLDSPLEVVVIEGSSLTIAPDVSPLAGVAKVSIRLPDDSLAPMALDGGQYKASLKAICGIYSIEAEPKGRWPAASRFFGVRVREDEPPCADAVVRDGVAECEAADDVGLASAKLVISPGSGDAIVVNLQLKRGDKSLKANVSIPSDRRLESGFSYYLSAKDLSGKTTKSAERKWTPAAPKRKHEEKTGVLDRPPRSLARPQKLGDPAGPPAGGGQGQDDKKKGGRPRVERLEGDKQESGGQRASQGPKKGAEQPDGYERPQGLRQPDKQEPSEAKEQGSQTGEKAEGQPKDGQPKEGKGQGQEGSKQGVGPGGQQEGDNGAGEDGGEQDGAGAGNGGQKPRDGGPKSGGETGGSAKPSPPDSAALSRMRGATPEEAAKKYGEKVGNPRTDFGKDKELQKDEEGKAPESPPMSIDDPSSAGRERKDAKGPPQARLDKVDPEYIPMVRGYFDRLRKGR